MMKCLIKKLNQSQGASLMLALLVFLICAMCGSVVLAAGTAAAGRVAGLKKSDQALYTLTSAAGAVGEELKTAQYSYIQDGETIKENTLTPENTIITVTMKSMCDMIADGKTTATAAATITATGSDLLSDSVSVQFTMDGNYNITAVFSSDTLDSTVTLTASGVPYIYSDSNTDPKRPVIHTWGDIEIVSGEMK